MTLSADEARHTEAVEHLIREHIREAGGWLSFETFMELALYAPGLGYYSAGSAKLGAQGDFITAPELSDAFSRCVANQCADVLAATNGNILELGAGTGRMAATILESLATLGALPTRYQILEVSADLRDRQRSRIAQLPAELRERVSWLDRLPETPMKGVILANEVLDALPCHRFVVRADGAHALGVGLDEHGDFVEREWPAMEGNTRGRVQEREHNTALVDSPASERSTRTDAGSVTLQGLDSTRIPSQPAGKSSSRTHAEQVRVAFAELSAQLPEPLPVGYRSEICTRVGPWIASLADQLESGVALLFDYGLPRAHYYHPQRSTGTLLCHFKHRAHDNPLINVGVQDITAWVDFTAVAESAVAAGLDVLGFVTQAAFLLGTGIESLAPPNASATEQARWASEVRQLLLPGEMGETFKAMALGRNFDAPLRGFGLQDLRRML